MMNVYSTQVVSNQHEAELRHRLRFEANDNAGENPNSGTLFLQSPDCKLKGKIYYNSSLLEFPYFARLIWDETERKIKISYYKDERDCFADRRTLARRVVSVIWAHTYEARKKEINETQWRDLLAQETSTVLSMNQTYSIEQCLTLEEVREVYRMKSLTNWGTGGASCMCIDPSYKSALRHTRADNGEDCYPCDAWLNDTTRVMRARDEVGNIVARFIAPMATNQFYSIYSTNGAVAGAVAETLKDSGWQQNQFMLEGCRLEIIETDENKVLMPYIDAQPNTMDAGGYLGAGNVTCNHSDGTASGLGGIPCDCCGASVDEDEIYWCESEGESVCQHCIDRDRYAWVYCGRGDRDLMNTNNYNVVEYGDEYYHKEYLDYYDLVVLHDGEVTHQDNAVFVESEGEYYPIKDCSVCPVTGEYYLNSDGEEIDGIDCTISPDGRDKIATKQNGRYILDEVANNTIEAETDAESMADDILDQFEDADSVDRDALVTYLQSIIDTLQDNTHAEDADAA